MLTLLINETKPLAGLFASTTGGIGSVPDISVADEGQAVSVQTFTRTAGVITDSFVAGDVLHIGIGDGVNAPVCYIALSSASPATGTMPINTAGMVALFDATVANRLSLQVGVVRTRGGNTNTIFSAPIVIHRSVIDPDTAVPTPSILGTGVAAALQVAINTALGFVRLDASARLPAVDGSQLTNLPGGGGGSGTVTSVAQSFTGGLISVAGSPITASGTLALTVAGTSGGIPYFSSGTTWATSAALAANALVVGGGAGAAPATVTTGANVLTALGVAVGTDGAFITRGGDAGTPSVIVLTNASGTASININGTVGATTPDTIAGTTGTFSGAVTGLTFNAVKINLGLGNDARSIALGDYALESTTTGLNNYAFGRLALNLTTTGSYNLAFGYAALTSNVTGGENTAIGNLALYRALGSRNVALGHAAGQYETGSDSLYIDNQDRTNTAGDKANALLYGTFAASAASQQLTINAGTVTLNGSAVTAASYAGAGTGLTGTASGLTAGNATLAATVTVANEATDTTCFPLFATDATGSLAAMSNAGLTFNSATGLLSATGLAGAFNGTVGATTPSTVAGTTGTFSDAVSTSGANATISTSGSDASLYTTGADAHIYTTGANATIQTRTTFRLSNGTYTTTLSHAPTADRSIALPNAAGTLALTTDITGGTLAGSFTTLTVNDNTTLGSNNSDTVNFNGRVASDINPATDNLYDLGVTGHEWRNLNIDGTANIDSLVADTADINGGTIDATSIGGTTPAAGSFTTLAASATTSLLLGTAGSAVGNIGFRNADSGTTTLAPATGALGTGTVTLPLSGTLATLAGTETLTNKSIAATQLTGTIADARNTVSNSTTTTMSALTTIGAAGAGTVNIPFTTSAASATTGALTIGNGTAATNVGIGGGNVNAGGTITGGGAYVRAAVSGAGGTDLVKIGSNVFLASGFAETRTNIPRALEVAGAFIMYGTGANGDATITRNASIGGTLSVTGATTLSAALITTPEALAPALNAGITVSVATVATGFALNGANAATLANGTNGQIKTIVCTAVTAAGTATLTPTTCTGYTTVAFTAAGQTLTLQYFTTGGWVILSVRGATPA